MQPTPELITVFALSYYMSGDYNAMYDLFLNYSATEMNDEDGKGPIKGTEKRDYTEKEIKEFLDKYGTKIETIADTLEDIVIKHIKES